MQVQIQITNANGRVDSFRGNPGWALWEIQQDHETLKLLDWDYRVAGVQDSESKVLLRRSLDDALQSEFFKK